MQNIVITVRRAVKEDIPNIMHFMDEHWKPGNILAKNRDFFEWQFMDNNKLNMFLGIDDKCHKIYGIMGAIVYSQNKQPDISGCTWQVIKSKNPRLGLDISVFMEKELNCRYNRGTSLSDKAVKLHKLLGYNVGSMEHYYRLADRSSYKIAKIKNKIIPKAEETGYSLEHIHSIEEMKQIISEEELAKQLLCKDYSYIRKRYFEHPIYHYDIWKIVDPKDISRSVLITRDERMEDTIICKIIDHYGRMEDLGKITKVIDRLMEERGYEFVDIYSYGIPVGIYEQAGFCCCGEDCENIIPNFFHPFVQENITLKLVDEPLENLRLFRGDGDQDRPC